MLASSQLYKRNTLKKASSVKITSLSAHEQDENVSPNVSCFDDLSVHNASSSERLESPLKLLLIIEQPTEAPFTSKMLPLPLTELCSEECKRMSSQSLSKKAKENVRSLSFSQEDRDEIEKSTWLQECPDWHKQRQGRLTASAFHDILVRRKQTNCESLLK